MIKTRMEDIKIIINEDDDDDDDDNNDGDQDDEDDERRRPNDGGNHKLQIYARHRSRSENPIPDKKKRASSRSDTTHEANVDGNKIWSLSIQTSRSIKIIETPNQPLDTSNSTNQDNNGAPNKSSNSKTRSTKLEKCLR